MAAATAPAGHAREKVLQGRVNYGRHQDAALTVAEKAQGKAPLLAAWPKAISSSSAREVSALRDISVKTLHARVQKMEKLAPDVMALSLKLPLTSG